MACLGCFSICPMKRDSSLSSSPSSSSCSPFRNCRTPFVFRKRVTVQSSLISASKKPELLKVMISGAPASGKGTQCEFIANKYGLVHIAAGDLLRAEISVGSENGKQAKSYMEKGKLVPDEIVVTMIKERLYQSDVQENSWLLDGYPRSLSQATALESSGIRPDIFILLNVSEKSLIERVVGRRLDPVTGRIYHLKYSPPENEEIAARLTQRFDDTEEKVKTDLSNSEKSKNWTPKSYGLTLYNCFTGAWHRHPAITVPIFAQCIAVGDKIILLGGWDSATLDAICDVHIIDVVTGECRRGKPMSTPRSFFACAAIGSLLYVAGGHDNQKNALKTAEVYDPITDEWRHLPPMLEERDECQGIAFRGKFLVISGYNTDNQGIFRRGGECYDPVNRTWEKEDDSLWGNRNDDDTDVSSSVHSPRSVCFVLPKASGADEEEEKIWHLECSERRRSMREYDSKQRRWRVVADIPTNLSSSPFVSVFRNPHASAGDGTVTKLFVVGSDGEKKHKSWVMNTGTKKWVELEFPDDFSGFAYSPAAFCV